MCEKSVVLSIKQMSREAAEWMLVYRILSKVSYILPILMSIMHSAIIWIY